MLCKLGFITPVKRHAGQLVIMCALLPASQTSGGTQEVNIGRGVGVVRKVSPTYFMIVSCWRVFCPARVVSFCRCGSVGHGQSVLARCDDECPLYFSQDGSSSNLIVQSKARTGVEVSLCSRVYDAYSTRTLHALSRSSLDFPFLWIRLHMSSFASRRTWFGLVKKA